MMVLVEIPDCPAVGYEIAVEAPFLQLAHEEVAGAGCLAVDTVISAHDALHVGVFHQRLECRQIGFLQILGGRCRIKGMAQGLRPAVHGEMLGAGGCFQHVFVVPLQPVDVCLAQLRSEERVFAESLVPSAPAGVTEDVDVGRPEGQPLVNVPVAVPGFLRIFGTCLGGCDICRLLCGCGVEHGSQSDRLGEHGRRAGTCQPVQPLVPPVVCRNAKPWNGVCIVFQLSHHLLDGHLIDQRLCTLLCRERGILVTLHKKPPFRCRKGHS